MNPSTSSSSIQPLTAGGRYTVLVIAFLGWLFAGTQMSITPLVSRASTASFLWPDEPTKSWATTLDKSEINLREQLIGKWFAANNAAFLLGAAAGGIAFGWFGDRFGRTKAVGWSILFYTGFSGVSFWSQDPSQFVVLRFLACLGVGGMWPNGIALVSEAWSNVSRPTLSGIIGTSANVGLVLVALVTMIPQYAITQSTWRWFMLISAIPLPLGLLALYVLPESPRWLASRNAPKVAGEKVPLVEIFVPPLLGFTLVGILLSTVPLFGGWGSGNWLVPWTAQVWDNVEPAYKSYTQFARSFGGTIGSLVGGWIASMLGRRRSYFLMSLLSLLASEYIYFFLHPEHPHFLWWVGIIGVTGGFFFGWMPLCFPEMFPTRVRSTGSGVTFNFGRITSALGVYGAGLLIQKLQGDYSMVGRYTSLIYVAGMIVILLAPDTSKKNIDE